MQLTHKYGIMDANKSGWAQGCPKPQADPKTEMKGLIP